MTTLASPPSRVFGPFTAGQVASYAAASADDNPLHTDPQLAARAGLERPPIHGMLLMACFERFLSDWQETISIERLSAKFLRPVLVDEAVEVSGKIVQTRGDGRNTLRLTAKRGSDLVCLAEATIKA